MLVVLVGCNQPARFGITFTSNHNNNVEIYHMTSDGQNVEQVTNTSNFNDRTVVASPDGHKILFDRDGTRLEREIYLLDVDTGAISQLTNAPAYDIAGAWSFDSKQIAFISDREGGYYRLYLMNPDGSDQRHLSLTTDSDRDVSSAVWSPNNRYIVYGTREHINAREVLTPTIFIVDLSTLEVRHLTDDQLGACGGGDWSPDSQWVAVVCTSSSSSDNDSAIYLIRYNGLDLGKITNVGEFGACKSPNWSPDGTRIAMVCTKGISVGDYGEVYTIRPDGTDLQQVTTKPADYHPNFPANSFQTWVDNPRWSPDGKQIVYLAAVNGPWNIYMIDVDGKNNRRLTNHNAVDWLLSVYRMP
jgi:TolB protein